MKLLNLTLIVMMAYMTAYATYETFKVTSTTYSSVYAIVSQK